MLARAAVAVAGCAVLSWWWAARRRRHLSVTLIDEPSSSAYSQEVSRTEALSLSDVQHACHVAIYAPVGYKLWGEVAAGHAALMQLRFDGLLGFPGGLVDRLAGGQLEDLAAAANRELTEELSSRVSVSDADYMYSTYIPGCRICTHFFAKQVTEAELDALERDALDAHDRYEARPHLLSTTR